MRFQVARFQIAVIWKVCDASSFGKPLVFSVFSTPIHQNSIFRPRFWMLKSLHFNMLSGVYDCRPIIHTVTNGLGLNWTPEQAYLCSPIHPIAFNDFMSHLKLVEENGDKRLIEFELIRKKIAVLSFIKNKQTFLPLGKDNNFISLHLGSIINKIENLTLKKIEKNR